MKLINPSEQIQLGTILTSRRELIDLIKAWIAISAAFAILLGGSLFSVNFITFFMISSLSVGLGFIAHEMSHKVVAQKYGCQAEFRSWDKMLILAVIMSFFGFIIAKEILLTAIMILNTMDKMQITKAMLQFIKIMGMVRSLTL